MEFYTVDQLAERWQVAPRTVRAMAAAGEVPAMKLGKLWRFGAASILKFEKVAGVGA